MIKYICTSMEECRRRGFTEFVAFELPNGQFNVRGPQNFDRIVDANVGCWYVEDLNDAMALGAKGVDAAKEEKWLIWSFATRAWWGPDRRGYYDSVDGAGRYSKADAEKAVCGGMLHRGFLDEKKVKLGPADVLVLAPESGGTGKRPRQMGWPKPGSDGGENRATTGGES